MLSNVGCVFIHTLLISHFGLICRQKFGFVSTKALRKLYALSTCKLDLDGAQHLIASSVFPTSQQQQQFTLTPHNPFALIHTYV